MKSAETQVCAYKRVVLIGVDGAGAFFQYADTPNIDKIFENGAVNHRVLSAKPTISAECWGSILIGVTPQVHRLNNLRCERMPRDTDSMFPSVFRVIREKDPAAKLASFCNWNAINKGIIEENLNVHKDTGNDVAVTEKVCKYIAENDPKFLFVQFDQVDGKGHSYNYGSKEYFEQIRITDGYIGQIYDAYKEQGLLEDALFLVTADHGGMRDYHGGQSDQEKYVMFAASGKNVIKGTIGDMEIRDSAAIVLHALGIEQSKTWTSRVPDRLFEGVTAGERPRYEVEIYDKTQRVHKSQPTPVPGNGESILDIIGKERIAAYLPLDGNISDVTGRMSPVRLGKLYFVDGYFGQGIQFEDGGICLGEHDLGNKSFSVAFWMKTGGMNWWANLFTNKDRPGDLIPGFNLYFGVGMILVVYTDGEKEKEIWQIYPEDFRDGWVHVVFVVDREAGEIRFSYDFDEFHVTKLPDSLKEMSMGGNNRLYIGSGKPNKSVESLYAVLDEYLIVDDALNQEDIIKLAKYYGVTG